VLTLKILSGLNAQNIYAVLLGTEYPKTF